MAKLNTGLWWSRPATVIGGLRPALRAASIADSFRLRQLPSVIGTVLLPLLAIGVPVAISVLHATTAPNQQPIPDQWTIVIHDVFTESLLFVLAALAIGIASPAAGALLVVVFGIGNMVVTVASGELEPLLPAAFGRLVSYGLLWLLVVEIPVLGRHTVEWTIHDEEAPAPRRRIGVALGAVVIAALTFAWAQATPMLITVVYFTTAAWGNPFLAAVQPVQTNDLLLAGVAGVAAVLLLGARYLGRLVVFSPPPGRSVLARLPGGPATRQVVAAAVGLALLSGVISAPIDAVVLVVGLLAARPAARLVISALRLAGPLSQLPWPLRLVLGFGAAVGVDWIVLNVFGVADWSRFSTVVLAVSVGLFVVALFTTADEVAVASEGQSERYGSVVPASLIGLAVVGLAALAFPTIASADNCGDLSDCWTDLLKASLAAAGAAVLAAQFAANNQFNRILPASYPRGGALGPDRPDDRDIPPAEMPDWYRDHLREHEGPPKVPPEQAPAYDPSGIRTGGGPAGG